MTLQVCLQDGLCFPSKVIVAKLCNFRNARPMSFPIILDSLVARVGDYWFGVKVNDLTFWKVVRELTGQTQVMSSKLSLQVFPQLSTNLITEMRCKNIEIFIVVECIECQGTLSSSNLSDGISPPQGCEYIPSLRYPVYPPTPKTALQSVPKLISESTSICELEV